MASLAMKRIYICGLKNDRKNILQSLQKQGMVEVRDFVPEDEVFRKSAMPISASEFEHSIHEAEMALDILKEVSGEKAPGLLSSFKGRTVLTDSEFDSFREQSQDTKTAISAIIRLNKDIAEKKAEIVKCTQQVEILAPWQALDISLDFSGTESTAAYIGALPGEWKEDGICTAVAQMTPADIDVDIISTAREQTCVMIIAGKADGANVSAALRSMGFSYPAVSVHETPADESRRLNEKIDRLNREIGECTEGILSYYEKKDAIKFLQDYLVIRGEKYSVISNLPQSEHTFVLSGYVPEKYLPDVEKLISGFDAVIESTDPEPDEELPVLLSNNAFSESVQGVVESYALPNKGEIDPTFMISVFYFIFFGFMLGDAAIGILIVIATIILLAVNKNMEKSLRRNVKLFLFGGIMTTFWGVMFGSYFGDMIPVVSESFFGKEVVVKPLWMDMTSNPMAVLSLSLAFGLIHIFTGLGVAGYQMIRQKDFVGFFSDVVSWFVIIAGLVVECLSMPMIMGILFSGRDPFFSSEIGSIGLYAAAAGAIVVVIMGGRESKNPLKRLLKGLYAVYGVTSYLSDLLSYSRLLALGLATGVISSVANKMGTMFGTGAVRVIIYLFIFIVINAVNIGINMLGAYVHTNRLMYVEFFGKFYGGGARAFQPFNIKTKYYKFKEN